MFQGSQYGRYLDFSFVFSPIRNLRQIYSVERRLLHIPPPHGPARSQSLLKRHWSVVLGLKTLPISKSCPLPTDIGYLFIRLALVRRVWWNLSLCQRWWNLLKCSISKMLSQCVSHVALFWQVLCCSFPRWYRDNFLLTGPSINWTVSRSIKLISFRFGPKVLFFSEIANIMLS